MKKLLQRFLGIAASAALLVTSSMTAFAAGHSHHSEDTVLAVPTSTEAEPVYTITLTIPSTYEINDNIDPRFGAYQIFTGTVKNGGTSYTNPGNTLEQIPLTDIKWGNAFGDVNTEKETWQENIVNFVLALADPYTDNGKYSAAFANFKDFSSFKSGSYLADEYYIDPTPDGNPIKEEEKIPANVNFDKLATKVADVINNRNDRTWLQAFTDILGGYGDKYAESANNNKGYVKQCYDDVAKKVDNSYTAPDKEKGTDGSYKITVPAGYYMILDKTGIDESTGGTDESYSARMLFVANNITQQIKQDVPSLEKKIMRSDGTEYNSDTEAAGVGDEVKFRLTGTLPSNYDQYTLGYQFKFTDTLSKGLTLKGLETSREIDDYTSISDNGFKVSVKGVYNGTTWESDTTLTISTTNVTEPITHTHVTEKAYTAKVKEETSGIQTLTVDFPCLKEILITGTGTEATGNGGVSGTTYTLGYDADANKGSEIYIDYVAVVDEDAVVSPKGDAGELNGNTNTAVLTYSDNPQSYDDTDDTTKEETTVYTFGLDIVKVDAADFLKNDKDLEKAGLSGAKFILVRPTATANEYEIAKFVTVAATTIETDPFKGEKYYSIDSWEKLGTLNSDTTLEKLFNTFVMGKTKTDYELETYSDTGEKGHLNISGLNDGVTYTMVETETPTADYAKINPFTITLTAQMNTEKTEYTGRLSNATSDQSIETGKSFSFDNPVDITDTFDGGAESDGSANMLVANFKYVDLPSTGGVGTYWFYILGAGGLAMSFVLFRLSKKKVA